MKEGESMEKTSADSRSAAVNLVLPASPVPPEFVPETGRSLSRSRGGSPMPHGKLRKVNTTGGNNHSINRSPIRSTSGAPRGLKSADHSPRKNGMPSPSSTVQNEKKGLRNSPADPGKPGAVAVSNFSALCLPPLSADDGESIDDNYNNMLGMIGAEREERRRQKFLEHSFSESPDQDGISDANHFSFSNPDDADLKYQLYNNSWSPNSATTTGAEREAQRRAKVSGNVYDYHVNNSLNSTRNNSNYSDGTYPTGAPSGAERNAQRRAKVGGNYDDAARRSPNHTDLERGSPPRDAATNQTYIHGAPGAASVQSQQPGASFVRSSNHSDTVLTSDAVQSEFHEEKNQKQYGLSKTVMCVIVVSCLVVVVIIVVVVVVVGGGSNGSHANNAVNASESNVSRRNVTMEDVWNLLPEATKVAIENNTESPQAKAQEWMSKDPHLSQYYNERILQRFGLVTFFYATGGAQWTTGNDGWLDYGKHECHWMSNSPCDEGGDKLTKNYATGFYKRLFMPKNGLQGTLPLEISFVVSLESISLSNNQIQGTLASEIGLLRNLQEFDLDENKLSGSLPTTFGSMSNLEQLSLQGNGLIGPIISELGQIWSLKELFLGKNQFQGKIPEDLFLLTGLTKMDMNNNHLSGSIGTEIGNMKSLQELFLQDNAFEGSLPTQIGRASSLESLQLYGNPSFGGSIPTELGLLSKLVDFSIYEASLSGYFPSELGNISGLRRLILNSNRLRGTLPTEVGRLTSLDRFLLYYNQISGSLPTQLGKLTDLLDFSMEVNNLNGPIPTEFGLLTGLTQIWLYGNRLTGTIPSELGLLIDVSRLMLDQNQLTGTIPEEMGLLAKGGGLGSLNEFNVTLDPLSGKAPDSLCGIYHFSFDCGGALCGCDCTCPSST